MGFRLVLTSMTMNDLARRNSPYFAFFTEFNSFSSSSSSSIIMGEGRASLPTSQLYTWI